MMKTKNRKLSFLNYGLFLILFIFFIILMRSFSDSPDAYIDDIELEFRGKIIKKYFAKTINLTIQTESKVINIAGLSKELEKNAQVGDSLIKIKKSNCCLLVKDTTRMKLRFIFIPERVLERSTYLRKIYERDCNKLIQIEH